MTTGRINQVTISERITSVRTQSHKRAKSISSRGYRFLNLQVCYIFVLFATLLSRNVKICSLDDCSLEWTDLCALYYSGLANSTLLLCGVKSNRSQNSVKIMIHSASQSKDRCSNQFHTSLRMVSKRLVWPAAISPQGFTLCFTRSKAGDRNIRIRFTKSSKYQT